MWQCVRSARHMWQQGPCILATMSVKFEKGACMIGRFGCTLCLSWLDQMAHSPSARQGRTVFNEGPSVFSVLLQPRLSHAPDLPVKRDLLSGPCAQ